MIEHIASISNTFSNCTIYAYLQILTFHYDYLVFKTRIFTVLLDLPLPLTEEGVKVDSKWQTYLQTSSRGDDACNKPLKASSTQSPKATVTIVSAGTCKFLQEPASFCMIIQDSTIQGANKKMDHLLHKFTLF